MKKALVLGASGGMGYALVRELVSRGIEVVAFARGEVRLKALFEKESNISIYVGDALVKENVSQAAKDVDVIFHAVNFPYPVWDATHLLVIDILIHVANAQQAKIALVDNIYAYGAASKEAISEDTQKDPHTKKGKIRLAMEDKLKASNVPSMIVHFPDFYGPFAESTMLHETLKNVVQHKSANFVGSTHVAREFIYTYDGAKAMVELALRESTYNQNWNIPAAYPITGDELIQIIREETGYEKPIRTVSKTMIRFIGLFQPFMREMVEMMYLTETPVVLSGQKYESEIGPVPVTSYQNGIRETVKSMMDKTNTVVDL